MSIKIVKNLSEMIVSANAKICKTERFVKETARFTAVDLFISQFAEGIIANSEKLFHSDFYKLSTEEKEHVFYVALGRGISSSENPEDVIFFGYEDKGDRNRRNDMTFLQYLSEKNELVFTVEKTERAREEEFAKLYLLSNDDQVNFPLLNAEQTKILSTEDANVLAQGVAGSGKTNVCIDKIVYSASRGYRGKVLYTTFSRGLLMDTESKVKLFVKNITAFKKALLEGKVIFKGDKKKAVENKLGVFLNVEEDSIADKLTSLADFLTNKVDFKLLRDFDKRETFADEEFFIDKFLNGQNRHVKGKLAKIPALSYEVVYKEIYGMILGYAEGISPQEIPTLEQYVSLREESFSKRECETIYSVALDYIKFLESENATDNNLISKKLIGDVEEPLYSLAVVDEVQDFTQINLAFIAKISRKVFAVGDALQMINPSYFGFAYLKRLLYEKDEIAVAELKHNYRNTQAVAEIVNSLSDLNVKKFGLHNFVLKGTAIGDDDARAIYFKDDGFADKLAIEKPNPFTIVVTSAEKKARIRKILPKQEVLTVAEIKGLERDTVLLLNVLSDNAEKWRAIGDANVNRKKADENSVYRYYFNLFYVGISRAKKNLFVVEKTDIPSFREFFQANFEKLDCQQGIKAIMKTVSKTDVDRDELVKRIEEFLKFGQYDNAFYTADKLQDDKENAYYRALIDVHKRYISSGDYKGAGIAYWKMGDVDRAKKTFELSGDYELIKLIDELSGKGDGKLDVDIVRFYPELKDNEAARNLIEKTLSDDLNEIKNDLRETRKKLKENKKYGKR